MSNIIKLIYVNLSIFKYIYYSKICNNQKGRIIFIVFLVTKPRQVGVKSKERLELGNQMEKRSHAGAWEPEESGYEIILIV